MGFEAPPAYSKTRSQDVPQGNVTGARTYFSGPGARSLVYTAGALMDFFETAPVLEHIALSNGSRGSLFRDGSDRWILLWYQDDECKQYTIGGSGFSQKEFMRFLAEDGVVSAGR